MLEFHDVSKSFCDKYKEVLVLDKINFKVNKGDIVVIVGPSGAGKSTILNLISELISPSEGNILVNGRVSYMFQRDCLLEWKSVYKNVLLYSDLNKKSLSKEELDKANKEAERLLKEYGLWEFRNNKPNSLSGGMRQRVALIRTLLSFPDLILLDEAFSALDYQTKLKVSEDIYSILKKENKTAIMVTHDIGEAISMGNKIIVLSNRPAHIKKIVDIDINDEGPINRRKSKAFQEYFDVIWAVIENNE